MTPEQRAKLIDTNERLEQVRRWIDPLFVTGVEEQPSTYLGLVALLDRQTWIINQAVATAIGRLHGTMSVVDPDQLATAITNRLGQAFATDG